MYAIRSYYDIENANSFAYMENDKIVVVSSTQIPHIVRRVCSQALGVGFGSVRIIKPYIGGGFGNEQDALTEPLNAYLTTRVGGRPVRLAYTREETFVITSYSIHYTKLYESNIGQPSIEMTFLNFARDCVE